MAADFDLAIIPTCVRRSPLVTLPAFPVPDTSLKRTLCSPARRLTAGVARTGPDEEEAVRATGVGVGGVTIGSGVAAAAAAAGGGVSTSVIRGVGVGVDGVGVFFVSAAASPSTSRLIKGSPTAARSPTS